jgi:uracil phosphoribosyltransferase
MMITMKFFAENVITIGTTEMSAQSLNNKRKPDAATCMWMRGALKMMTGVLEEMEQE